MNIIKGTYELNDGKLEDCAKRECMEEAGIDVEIIEVHSVMFFNNDDKLKIQYNFIAKPIGYNISLPNERNIAIESENIQAVKWVTPEEIKQLSASDFVADYTLGVLESWLDSKALYPLDIFRY